MAAEEAPQAAVRQRLAASVTALQHFRNGASAATLKLLDSSLCVGVAPRRPVALTATGEAGFLSCRLNPGGNWSNPAAIEIQGGGVYWPVMGTEMDVIILALNQSSASRLETPETLLGADLGTIPGPVSAEEIPLRSEYPVIFVYQQSAAGIAGFNIAGGTVRQDPVANAVLYGREPGTSAVLTRKDGGGSLIPVAPFLAALPQSAAGKSSQEAAVQGAGPEDPDVRNAR